MRINTGHRLFRTNGKLIAAYGIDLVSSFYHLKNACPNSVIHPRKDGIAKRLNLTVSTVRKRIARLIDAGLATRNERGFVVLRRIGETITEANGGSFPRYKETIAIQEGATLGDIRRELEFKGFQRVLSQAIYSRTKTEIEQEVAMRYGHVHSPSIRKRLSKEVKLEMKREDVRAPFAGTTAAKAIGRSLRTWHTRQRKWRKEGRIDSVRNEISLGLRLTWNEFDLLKDDLGAEYHGKAVLRGGQVWVIRPNLHRAVPLTTALGLLK